MPQMVDVPPTQISRRRTQAACDVCVLRRVKCDEQRPCRECQKRCLECVTQKQRRKRGPKGPRVPKVDKTSPTQSTSPPQQPIVHAVPVTETPATPSTHAISSSDDSAVAAISHDSSLSLDFTCHQAPIPLKVYLHYLEIFRRRLFSIWPVVNISRLIAQISSHNADPEAFSLASAVCAATIAQLRLATHSSHDFAKDAQRRRETFDYRERATMSSFLTSFFLHMYYANTTKLMTAGLLLREAIAYAHILGLDQADVRKTDDLSEHALNVRAFWLLFMTERTFCIQNNLPSTLHPIDTIPDSQDYVEGVDLVAFASLTKLFSHLHAAIASPSRRRPRREGDSPPTVNRTLGAYNPGDEAKQGLGFNETQRADLCITRHWIRILAWEYLLGQCAASYSSDSVFSLFLPVTVGQEILSTFAAIDAGAIRSHGYGMEIKLFKVADSVIDVMTCAPRAAWSDGMLLGSGDVLQSLMTTLGAVGGAQSKFMSKLQSRLATLDAAPSPSCGLLLTHGPHEEAEQVIEQGLVP